MHVPDLDDRIAQHAQALMAGSTTAESFLDGSARETYHEATRAIASMRPFNTWQPLALARIGFQYMSKIRLIGSNTAATLLIRWKQGEDGRWVIAGAEDISIKRSPWSDIPHYSKERGGDHNG